ncbi:hypothetical protein BLNAU_12301 [Blattamonas nauphoetae]|uniref:Uncharacterized protein n=1 Tax=Blattamonas nauphoetae TaxID=2049346 RepID=A0ABQ9XMM6_9EUKA|nr:hypothetical protein BLNAU_12301 [Blattamonas nauphoetae]
MYFDQHSTTPQIANAKAEQTLFLEMIIHRIYGDCISLRPVMLNALLVLVNDDFRTRSAIRDMNYLQAVERYCEMTSGDVVPTSLPELLCVLGKSSEDELDRICQSTIPSFLLESMLVMKNTTVITEIGHCLLLMTSTLPSSSTFLAHHKPKFLAFIDHCASTLPMDRFSSIEYKLDSSPHLPILSQLCFSPHPQISKLPLNVLFRSSVVYETRDFLQKLKIPSVSTEWLSKSIPFVEQLCGMLTEHVSQMRSLFTESTPDDPTISSLSAKLPDESPHLFRNAVLEMLCEGFSLTENLLAGSNRVFEEILLTCDFAPLLKATIIACLDLLDLTNTEPNCGPPGQTDLLVKLIDCSWKSTTCCLMGSCSTLNRLVGNTFSDPSDLCSLLERTCRHSLPTCPTHLKMIDIICSRLPHSFPRLLEEDLVHRVINASKPTTIPTTHKQFHMNLIKALEELIKRHKFIKNREDEWRRVRQLQFQRVLKPAQQYLLFILQREEFTLNVPAYHKPDRIRSDNLLFQTLQLERDLFTIGEIVETGREEWEVGWLVEMTAEKELGDTIGNLCTSPVKSDGFRSSNGPLRLAYSASSVPLMKSWSVRGFESVLISKTRGEHVPTLCEVSIFFGLSTPPTHILFLSLLATLEPSSPPQTALLPSPLPLPHPTLPSLMSGLDASVQPSIQQEETSMDCC